MPQVRARFLGVNLGQHMPTRLSNQSHPARLSPTQPVASNYLYANYLYSDVNTGGNMRHRIPHLTCLVTCVVILTTAAHAQPSHWAAPDDKTANFMIDLERKWAEGVCVNNGVVSDLLADDF